MIFLMEARISSMDGSFDLPGSLIGYPSQKPCCSPLMYCRSASLYTSDLIFHGSHGGVGFLSGGESPDHVPVRGSPAPGGGVRLVAAMGAKRGFSSGIEIPNHLSRTA